MKTILIIIAVLCAGKVNSFQEKQISGVEGHVKSIDFDSDFNAYVITNLNDTSYFYKIDNGKNVTFSQKLNEVEKVVMSRGSDVYIFDKTYSDPDPNHKVPEYSLWTANSDSQELSKLYYWVGNYLSLIDKSGNVILSTNNGITFIKYGQNVFKTLSIRERISKIENDKDDNIFFRGVEYDFKIDNQNKNESTPPIEPGRKLSRGSQLDSTEMDFNGAVYTTTGDYSGANLNKVFNEINDPLTLHSQKNSAFNFFYKTDDRLYLTSVIPGKHFTIYFVTKNDNVTGVREIFEFPVLTCGRYTCATDSAGNVFLAHGKNVLTIKSSGTQVRKIRPLSGGKVSSVVVDHNDDLWILAGNLYFNKNGTQDVVVVGNFTGAEDSPLSENKKTGEIYAGSENGLFAILNDNV